jgi:RNA polymerase sigma factor (sigma-70 family)
MCDADLLKRYVADRSAEAFAQLVARHLNLVYSAARRQTGSATLAEDVAQSVFIELARHAGDIKPATPLVAWLHVVTRRRALNTMRDAIRRHVREQQAAELATTLTPSEPPPWSAVEPLLDEAVESLTETDRHAILLRFFENKSLREVGAALGTTDDAAQKRVSRALDELRAFFVRRGVTITAASLASDLSAHAIQAAPAALGTAIAAAPAVSSALLGSAAAGARTVAAGTAQKITLAMVGAALASGLVWETTEIFRQRREVAVAQEYSDRLQIELRQLLADQRIAGQGLRRAQRNLTAQLTSSSEIDAEIRAWLARVDRLKQLARKGGAKVIPELSLLEEKSWIDVARNAELDTPEHIAAALTELGIKAKSSLAVLFHEALSDYANAHEGLLPVDPAELAPFLVPPLPPGLFTRYEMRQSGKMFEVPQHEWLLAERPAIARENGSQLYVARHEFGSESLSHVPEIELRHALRAFVAANPGRLPTAADQLLPYFPAPPMGEARKNFLENSAAYFGPAELQKLLD